MGRPGAGSPIRHCWPIARTHSEIFPMRQLWRGGSSALSRHGCSRAEECHPCTSSLWRITRACALRRPDSCSSCSRGLARRGASPGVLVWHRSNDRRRYRARGSTSYHRHALGSLWLVVSRSVDGVPAPARPDPRRSARARWRPDRGWCPVIPGPHANRPERRGSTRRSPYTSGRQPKQRRPPAPAPGQTHIAPPRARRIGNLRQRLE